MRKINTLKNKEKKDRTKQFLVGGVLIFIMLFSVLGYGFYGDGGSNNNQNINYNGFEFVNENGLWSVDIGNINFIFKNNPNEVPKISSEINYLNTYSKKPLYIKSESNEAEFEVFNNLRQVVQRMQYACVNKDDCEDNLPIKNCTNNFIIIQVSDNIDIIQEGAKITAAIQVCQSLANDWDYRHK